MILIRACCAPKRRQFVQEFAKAIRGFPRVMPKSRDFRVEEIQTFSTLRKSRGPRFFFSFLQRLGPPAPELGLSGSKEEAALSMLVISSSGHFIRRRLPLRFPAEEPRQACGKNQGLLNRRTRPNLRRPGCSRSGGTASIESSIQNQRISDLANPIIVCTTSAFNFSRPPRRRVLHSFPAATFSPMGGAARVLSTGFSTTPGHIIFVSPPPSKRFCISGTALSSSSMMRFCLPFDPLGLRSFLRVLLPQSTDVAGHRFFECGSQFVGRHAVQK